MIDIFRYLYGTNHDMPSILVFCKSREWENFMLKPMAPPQRNLGILGGAAPATTRLVRMLDACHDCPDEAVGAHGTGRETRPAGVRPYRS